ncbi:site-specific DNA-methyltransferase [bacterium]|nr:site-specific DNA-methyltransferase [bacterium]
MTTKNNPELTAFINWKRYNKNGQTELIDISFQDNFIIKGNNLNTLKALVPIYRNKIKLICIDPPYNTGGNKFNYNDNYGHSAWLTFMEERLIVARKLLTEDGIIYIHCDDQENAYLKVLCDKIFGREHFITNLIWRKKAGGANDSNDIAVEHEYILAYRKNKNGIYKIPLDAKTIASYKYEDDKLKTHGKYKIKDLNDPSLSDSTGLHYDIKCPNGIILKANEHQWKCNKKTFNERLKDNRIIFKKNRDIWKVYYKIYLNEQRGKLVYDEDEKLIPRGRNLSSILYNVALNKDGTTDIKNLFDGEKPFSYPKPVKLLKTLIQSASKPGDIVLDFFAGSGTTGQAILELNQEFERRQFILIEQMDYINDVTVPRIIKSLDFYNSEESFVYCELQQDENFRSVV